MTWNVAAMVDRRAEALTYQRAIIVPVRQGDTVSYQHLTYAALRRRIDRVARGFRALGLGPGDRVSVFLKPGFDFPTVVFALMKIGASPVFIDPGMGRKAVLDCLARMAPTALVAIPLLHAVRPLFGSAFRSVKHYVTAGSSTGYWGGLTLDALMALDPSDAPLEPTDPDPDSEAAILFTSGSTGPAKGARYTPRIFCSQTEFIQQMYGIAPGEIDVPGLPVFGLFSLAMGMSIAIPEIEPTKPAALDPSRLVDLIEDLGATSAFGSIAIWRPVARYCQQTGRKLPSLKRILSAGTAIPVDMHRAFSEILAPGAEIHTPYGATEALPVATIASRAVLGETAAATLAGAGTCVGTLAPGVAVRILRTSDAPVAAWRPEDQLGPGQIGEICVTGPQATHLYEGDPAATEASKIREGGTIWHRMGDLGYLDAQGRLWFCGRKAHRVETADGTRYSVPCEEIANQHPAVRRSALVGVGEPGCAEPVIVLELEAGATTPQSQVASEVRAILAAQPRSAGIRRVLFHPSFPVDVRHNAKIHNNELASWAAAELAKAPKLGLEGA